MNDRTVSVFDKARDFLRGTREMDMADSLNLARAETEKATVDRVDQTRFYYGRTRWKQVGSGWKGYAYALGTEGMVNVSLMRIRGRWVLEHQPSRSLDRRSGRGFAYTTGREPRQDTAQEAAIQSALSKLAATLDGLVGTNWVTGNSTAQTKRPSYGLASR
jgi:hypothetical protein